MKEIYFSIVIPTWMRCDSLLRLVDSILAQNFSYDLFEILIIDSKSSDGTRERLEEKIKGIRGLNLKILDCETNKPSSKRNLGIRSSNGQWLIFIDDDCEVTQDYLNIYFNKIQKLNSQKTIICGEVKYPDAWIAKSNYFRYRDSRHVNSRNVSKNIRPFDFRTITTMNMAINTILIRSAEIYFDENYIFSCEDSDFGFQLTLNGFQYEYCNATVLHYESCGNIGEYAKKVEKISSQGFSLMHKKYPQAAKDMIWYFLEPKPGFLEKLLFKLKKIILNSLAKKLFILILEKTDKHKILYAEILYKYVIACCYIGGIRNTQI